MIMSVWADTPAFPATKLMIIGVGRASGRQQRWISD
jgi:hypothetical protein